MIVMPAIDLRAGACVQLVGGSYDDERVHLPDPIAAAQAWQLLGFQHFHVIDLDAATDRGSNRDVIRRLLRIPSTQIQVGGGVSTAETIRWLFRDGAARVVVGTRAIEDVLWLRNIAQAYPRRLVVAADVRERTVVTRGWSRASGRDVIDVVRELNHLPLAGIMVTAVHNEGRMCGPDLALVTDVVRASTHPVQASGGIASLADLRLLAAAGAAAAIVGMALYTGALDAGAVASEFSQLVPQ
jgi:phosphoribosylformimino-5-aminoimidazole carboxamide ribotide isomerase